MDLDLAIRRFDLLGWVLEHGGEETKEGEWAIPCPGCGKAKLIVNVTRKAWHCWVCQEYATYWVNGVPQRRALRGAGGLLDLLQLVKGWDREDAARFVLSASRTSVEELAYIQQHIVPQGPVPGSRTAVAIDPPEHWERIDGILPYMAKRGISLTDVQTFGLFWCSAGRYRNRLVFPVWEEGVLVYYQARAMWEPRPGERFVKALNPAKQDGAAVSSDVLMNLDVAKRYPRVAITEGPIDAVRTGPDAVCTFGKQISGTQIAKLQRAGVKAVDLMWDADAQREIWNAAPTLAGLFDVRVVTLPHGDPGDFTRDQLNALRAHGTHFRNLSRTQLVR